MCGGTAAARHNRRPCTAGGRHACAEHGVAATSPYSLSLGSLAASARFGAERSKVRPTLAFAGVTTVSV
jgi:hypothetical protein